MNLDDAGRDDILGLVLGSDKEAGHVEDGGGVVLVELAAEAVRVRSDHVGVSCGLSHGGM